MAFHSDGETGADGGRKASEHVRKLVEKRLSAASWQVTGPDGEPIYSPGVAVRSGLGSIGLDYLLLVRGVPIGLVEVGENEGEVEKIAKHAQEMKKLPANKLEELGTVRFFYATDGADILFVDLKNPHPQPRRIFAFHGPLRLVELHPEIYLNARRLSWGRFSSRPAAEVEKVPSEEEENSEPVPVQLIEGAREPEHSKEKVKVFVISSDSEERRDAHTTATTTTTTTETEIFPIAEREKPEKSVARKTHHVKHKHRKIVPKPVAKKPVAKPVAPGPHRHKPFSLVFGTFGIDRIKNSAGIVKEVYAGPAAYSAIASSVFSRTGIVGNFGKDYSEPEELSRLDGAGIAKLKEKGPLVSWRHPKSANAPVSPAIRGGKEFSRLPDLPKKYLRRGKFVLLGNSDPSFQLSALSHLKKPSFVGLQIGGQWLKKRRKDVLEAVGKSTAVLLTEQQLRKLSGGERNTFKAAEKLRLLGPSLVLVKQGEHGIFLLGKSGAPFFAPVPQAKKTVDPVGTWESFAGAFVGYLAARGKADEETARKAVVWALALSSFKPEGFGLGGLASVSRSDAEERFSAIRKSVET
jgi:hypothetical protein